MSTSRKNRALSFFAVMLLSLGGILQAQEGFLEDFEDGDIFDGTPVSWGSDVLPR